jgi:integrase
MPNVARGEVRFSGGICRARIALKGKKRLDVELPTFAPDDRVEAQRRAECLSAQAKRLRRAGKRDTTSAIELLRALGREPNVETGDVIKVVDALCGAVGDPLAVRTSRAEGPTFTQLAKRWTDGDLAREYPDHVQAKKTSDLDAARLRVICKVSVGGRAFGDPALATLTLADCKTVMGALPATTKRTATRRKCGQLVSRVLAMAVFPCEHISRSPLPRGFLPRIGKPPYLYPSEDAALLGHQPIPLDRRLLWGFLAREGCRVSEALALRVGLDVDLERGAIRLDKNKTDDPRAWALDPGVSRALATYVTLRGAKTGEPLFRADTRDDKLAEQLRADLEAAFVKRQSSTRTGRTLRRCASTTSAGHS